MKKTGILSLFLLIFRDSFLARLQKWSNFNEFVKHTQKFFRNFLIYVHMPKKPFPEIGLVFYALIPLIQNQWKLVVFIQAFLPADRASGKKRRFMCDDICNLVSKLMEYILTMFNFFRSWFFFFPPTYALCPYPQIWHRQKQKISFHICHIFPRA